MMRAPMLRAAFYGSDFFRQLKREVTDFTLAVAHEGRALEADLRPEFAHLHALLTGPDYAATRALLQDDLNTLMRNPGGKVVPLVRMNHGELAQLLPMLPLFALHHTQAVEAEPEPLARSASGWRRWPDVRVAQAG